MKLTTAVVLVGGKGMRLRPLTNDTPKCMITVSGKPLLHWIMRWLKNNGIERVVLGVAYKKEVIEEYVKGTDFGMDVLLNDHSEAEGTGDAFRLAIENQDIRDELFLAMNGDELTDIHLNNILTFHSQHSPVATLVVIPLKSPYGVISTDAFHTITEFQEKPTLEGYFMNAGIYLFTQKIREHLPDKGDIENTTFKELAKLGELKAFKYFGFWNTINNVKELREIEKNVESLQGVWE